MRIKLEQIIQDKTSLAQALSIFSSALNNIRIDYLDSSNAMTLEHVLHARYFYAEEKNIDKRLSILYDFSGFLNNYTSCEPRANNILMVQEICKLLDLEYSQEALNLLREFTRDLPEIFGSEKEMFYNKAKEAVGSGNSYFTTKLVEKILSKYL